MRKYTSLLLSLGAGLFLTNCDQSAINALAEAASQTVYSTPPQVHPYRAQTDYYSSGYYPYSVSPQTIPNSERRAHAYDVAFRVGQDDYHHGRPNHMDQHKKLFDSVTHDAFRNGYKAGYDAARRKDKKR